MNPAYSRVIISNQDTSGVATRLDPRATLWRLDEASDIAIFRIIVEEDCYRPSVKLRQLALPLSDSLQFPIWTVAYSCNDSDLNSDVGKEFLKKQDHTEGTKNSVSVLGIRVSRYPQVNSTRVINH